MVEEGRRGWGGGEQERRLDDFNLCKQRQRMRQAL